MAYVTRAMRERARADADEAKHPEWAGQRVRRRELCEQAIRERAERFQVLSIENAEEAIRWQQARVLELELAEGLR